MTRMNWHGMLLLYCTSENKKCSNADVKPFRDLLGSALKSLENILVFKTLLS